MSLYSVLPKPPSTIYRMHRLEQEEPAMKTTISFLFPIFLQMHFSHSIALLGFFSSNIERMKKNQGKIATEDEKVKWIPRVMTH